MARIIKADDFGQRKMRRKEKGSSDGLLVSESEGGRGRWWVKQKKKTGMAMGTN